LPGKPLAESGHLNDFMVAAAAKERLLRHFLRNEQKVVSNT